MPVYFARKGKGQTTKTDEFSDKFQTAFEPPLIFRKIILQNFVRKRLKKALYKGPKSAT